MNRTRLLLSTVLLGVLLSAVLALSLPRKTSEKVRAPRSSAPAGEGPGPVALASKPGASRATPAVGSRWWFEMTMRQAAPEIRSARLEASWWSTRPASPLQAPEAVFQSAEADLSHGDALVEVAGDANPGWVVLFVVAGERRELADPWSAEPRFQVEAGRGFGAAHDASGAVVPVLVGARDLLLHVLDRDGAPVAELVVDARVPTGGRVQRRQTDVAGRARFPSFPEREAIVSWRQAERRTSRGGEETLAKEFADGSPRLVAWGEEAESVVRIARNPRIRLRVRIEGAPQDAWCPASYVRVDHAPGVGHTWDGALGFFLPAGTWTCRTQVFGAGDVSATARDLALDDTSWWTPRRRWLPTPPGSMSSSPRVKDARMHGSRRRSRPGGRAPRRDGAV